MNTGLGRMFGFGGNQPEAGGGQSGGNQGQGGGGGGKDDAGFDTSGSPFYEGESGGGGHQESNAGSILAGIFSPDGEEGDGDDGNQGQNQNRGQGQQQGGGGQGGNQNQNSNQNGNGGSGGEHEALAQELARGIQALTLPQDAFPENFDPTDPAQMTQVMQRTMQQTAMAAIQLSFRPMQAAMQQLTKDVKAEIQASLNGFGDQQRNRTTLNSIVPEAEDPQYAPMVNMLFEQAMKKKNATANQAAKAVRSALDAMGIRGSSSNRNSGGDPMAGGFKEGKSALDAFAPLPSNFGNQGQNQQRR